MPSSRQRRRAHTDNDGAWGHTLNDAWRDQLDAVHSALNKLGDPLREPLTTVSGAAFIDVLWRLPVPKRGRFLADLKVPAAKRPTPGTEENIGAAALARMTRWKDERLTSALEFVLYDVLSRPVTELAHSEGDLDTLLGLAADCVTELRQSGVAEGLIAAGLVADLRDVAFGVALTAWLKASPLPGVAADGGHAAVADELIRILRDLPWDTVTPSDAGAVDEEPHGHDHGHIPTDTAAHAEEPAAFDTSHTAAVNAYSVATEQLTAALDQVAARQPPDVAAVTTALQAVEAKHARVAALASASASEAGLPAPPASASLAVLAEVHTAAREALEPWKLQTQRLRTLELTGDLSACVQPLEVLCGTAEDGDESAIAVIDGLLRLADAKATGASFAELSALDNEIRPTLPAELAPLLLGLMLGQAQLPIDAAPEPVGASIVAPAPAVVDLEDDAAATPADPDAAEPSVLGATAGESSEPTAEDVIDNDAASVTPPPVDPGDESAKDEHLAASDPAPATSEPPLVPAEPMQAPAPVVTVPAGHEVGESDLPDADTVDDIDPDADVLRGLVRAAVDEQDTGLGYWLALTGQDTALADALKATVLSETLRGDTGPVAAAAIDALESLDPEALNSDRLAALAALAAALRTTLVTGSPDAGAVLELLAVHVVGQIGLANLINAVAVAAQRGALAGGQLRALRDGSSVTAELNQVRQDAQTELTRSRSNTLARATDMAVELFAPHGAIGELLSAVVSDDRAALDKVDSDYLELSDPDGVRRFVDARDRATRRTGSSARPLQGKARSKLLSWIESALVPVREWIRIARLQQASSGDRHLPADLVTVKTAAATSAASILDELGTLTAAGDDNASGAVMLRAAVELSERLLAGKPPVGSCDGCEVDEVLGRALLRAPLISLDKSLRPVDPAAVTLSALVEALGASWDDVISARISSGDFGTARHAIAVATTGTPHQQEQQTLALDEQLATRRVTTAERLKRLREQVGLATRLGQLGNDDQIRLAADLEKADPKTREDLNIVDDELDRIERALPELAAAAAGELSAKLHQLVESGTVGVDAERRIQERIAGNDLASADEILAAVEAGLDLPELVTLDLLTEFFPAIPKALPSGLTGDVIVAVRAGGSAGGCDYSRLPEGTRDTNAQALASWMAAATATQRHSVAFQALAPALRLAGIEARADGQTPAAIRDARSGDRRFLDLAGVSVTGNALVPAFGSRLNGQLRLLLVWGPQTPQTIINWVKQDTSDLPVLVCLFGTMFAEARGKLAIATKDVPGKPVVVLDDAALAFLASQPDASITTTMRILLPFLTTNPYVPQAEGNVPSEMFYGRTTELSDLLAHPGTSLVYGGRQLGKSALLRAAKRRHTSNGSGIAVVVSTQPAQQSEEIWDLLRSALEREGIKPTGRDARRDAYSATVAAVQAWLDANPDQRLLVLFDECDNYFDLDANDGFKQTTRLRDLRNQTDTRFKPVFAGLHEVARFASLPNQPFAHLGKPTPIGPLAPAEAFRLVTEPMAALGIKLDDVAWRVLAYCNYQPILLQLVCQHIVKHVSSTRDDLTPLPIELTEDEFERVWKSPELVSEVSGKLRLTLDLDPRYGVVGRVLGLAALDEPKVLAMSTVQLREECENWWAPGFSSATEDEFRALLIEMVTLGVLTQEGPNWALRSANVRRMLGTSEDMLANLDWAGQATPPGPHVAGEARQMLPDARVAPLTEKQLGDVIGERNQLRIILGSRATGADMIGELLAQARGTLGRFDLIKPSRRSVFIEALTSGERGGRHRVVYSDITDVTGDDKVLAEIDEARNLTPGDGVTRSAVLHLDVARADVWLELLEPGRGRMAADTVVACRRLDRIGLERWSHEQHGQFSDPDEREKLLAQTGGWPLLVDYVAGICAAGAGSSEALATLRTQLDGDLGEELVAAVGIGGSVLEASYGALVALGADLLQAEPDESFEEVIAAHTPQPHVMLAALVATGAVTRNDESSCSLEKVLAEQWTTHRAG